MNIYTLILQEQTTITFFQNLVVMRINIFLGAYPPHPVLDTQLIAVILYRLYCYFILPLPFSTRSNCRSMITLDSKV